VDESNEIKKALKICGGNWNGIAFENMLARKTNEKLKILLHKRILIRGTDNLVLWYTQNNNGREMK